MSSLRDIPEIQGLDSRRGLVRIPPELDVPLTPRVRRLIDAAPFRRLAHISQLGLVSLVYPAANHSRFEHSLGVYRMGLLYLRRLSYDDRFQSAVSAQDAEALIAAALLHDVGHWPFCHLIEDMRLPDVPKHEQFARRHILESEIADALREDWGLDPERVAGLFTGDHTDAGSRILQSILSSPIDIDKMDYLERDSLHAGTPYGRNFDQQRLIGSLCLNEAGDGLAITEKGRTAAEMMVFARYVMFSEVYWHHAVRAATAMLQRAFYRAHRQLDLAALFRLTEQPFLASLFEAADDPARELLDSLFGPSRRLYKRLAQYSYFQHRETYELLARRPYPWLASCAEEFARLAGERLGIVVAPHEVLFDAPPVQLEVQFNVQVFSPRDRAYWPLGEISPVVHTLARRQFDDYVKRVRIFIHPRLAREMEKLHDLPPLLQAAAANVDAAV
ncbi:MAG: HD domain-containing protein [Planctomycetes bacterium]|nr:HD domain-containing protein [Planctomycetota bacterium]